MAPPAPARTPPVGPPDARESGLTPRQLQRCAPRRVHPPPPRVPPGVPPPSPVRQPPGPHWYPETLRRVPPGAVGRARRLRRACRHVIGVSGGRPGVGQGRSDCGRGRGPDVRGGPVHRRFPPPFDPDRLNALQQEASRVHHRKAICAAAGARAVGVLAPVPLGRTAPRPGRDRVALLRSSWGAGEGITLAVSSG
jgi:hypothetical protein